MKQTSNEALREIGVKLDCDFEFRYLFSIHTLSSRSQPPRELER